MPRVNSDIQTPKSSITNYMASYMQSEKSKENSVASFALNEQAPQVIGRWCLSACVILSEQSEQCMLRALNERAMQVMGRWSLSARVILSQPSEQCMPRVLNEWAMWMIGRWYLSAWVILHKRSEPSWWVRTQRSKAQQERALSASISIFRKVDLVLCSVRFILGLGGMGTPILSLN